MYWERNILNVVAGKKKNNWKKAAVGVAAGLAIVSGAYWKVSTPQGKVGILAPAYEVKRVIDGDTFETTQDQLIRLSDVFAPELEYCGGVEAKEQLEILISGKAVYLKVLYRDRYMRLLSVVYTKDGFVNERMVANGAAVYKLSGNQTRETKLLEKTAKTAKENSLGVWSDKCTQAVNPENPKCVIKGNIRSGETTKIYSLPGCESYASTIIQLHLGDRWFCTEKEAIKAGFTKAGGCNLVR